MNLWEVIELAQKQKCYIKVEYEDGKYNIKFKNINFSDGRVGDLIIPNFQITDCSAALEYYFNNYKEDMNLSLQQDYMSGKKELYSIYLPEE